MRRVFETYLVIEAGRWNHSTGRFNGERLSPERLSATGTPERPRGPPGLDAALAYPHSPALLTDAKIGILLGSLAAGLAGVSVLGITTRKPSRSPV
jgi:hypothetical protein